MRARDRAVSERRINSAAVRGDIRGSLWRFLNVSSLYCANSLPPCRRSVRKKRNKKQTNMCTMDIPDT